jgi:biopolymer transport protein ExbB
MGSPEPTVIPIGEGAVPDIQALTRTGSGNLPLDATMGNALKIASIEEGFVDHLMKGGPVMIPILLLGTTAFLVGLVKYIQISLIHSARPRDLQTILESLRRGDKPAAKAQASGIKGPAGEMLLTAISHADDDRELIEEVLYEKMLHTKPRLERLLPFIALTAACAPLLGLLGTVTGMINTFNLITIFGTGDPKMLSSGISEALITTEYGLKIAIPALLVHALISRKTKGIMAGMEQTAVGFINGIPGKP